MTAWDRDGESDTETEIDKRVGELAHPGRKRSSVNSTDRNTKRK